MKITITEIIGYFEQDFQSPHPWNFTPVASKDVAAYLKNLESAGRALLEWHVEWYRSYHQWNRPEREVRELTALIERFRALLEPNTSEDKQEGEK